MQKNKKQETLKFFRAYSKALNFSPEIKKDGLALIQLLQKHDPLDITRFEFSFKIKQEKILPILRFLNIDAHGYSCRSPFLFINRLDSFKEIITGTGSRLPAKIYRALKEISANPMDLYFGADIFSDKYLFAFWLIFGGVNNQGQANFWPYDFKKILANFWRATSFRPPKIIKEKILNLGIDIVDNKINYKFYYLYQKNSFPLFQVLVKEIDKKINGHKYFYFVSEMYNPQGRFLNTKLFIEFLEKLDKIKTIKTILNKLAKIEQISLRPSNLVTTLKVIEGKGRISLISFEKDGTLTFYLRPN